MMETPLFPSSTVTLACTSDTHNDDPTPHIPAADIFLHAGDMTDDGSLGELQAAYSWISVLPHKIKVIVAGNHDLGLDRAHPAFCQEARDLFTSDEARRKGIVYLDREVRAIANCADEEGKLRPLKVYGNPHQPDFLKSSYAFTYLPYPDKSAEEAWEGAPGEGDGVSIWVCHSPPKGILDQVPVEGLTGCEVLRRRVEEARPMVCVFGHYHSSYGRRGVRWEGEEGGVEEEVTDLMERGMGAGRTLFLNAAWMTMHKTKVEKRNLPWLVRLRLDER